MKHLLIFALLILLFTGCKPTEKGYKAAYDTALGKRESAYKELDANIPDGRLQEVDGAQL